MIVAGIIGSGDEDKAITPTNVSQSQQETSKTIKFVDNSNGLRLRDEPSLSAEILEVLKDKTKVEVLAKKDEWTQVKAGSNQGWVASKYLAEQKTQAKKNIQTTDNIAVNQIKKVFKNLDLSLESIEVVESDINRRLLLTYISTASTSGELRKETKYILNAYLGQVKRNWDIDGFVVIIGNTNEMMTGMWYCSEEWTNGYKAGKISLEETENKVFNTLEKGF